MFDIKPQTLQYWYKNFLSDYFPDIESNRWHPQKIETVDKATGEIKEKPVYVFKKENLGEHMCIDDKAIGHTGFSILSNNKTGKIALMIESANSKEVEQAMSLFGKELWRIKSISMDMSPTYALVCNNLIPRATQVIDKFHVMKYVYDAVGNARIRINKELTATLTKGKKKTEQDKETLSELELLRRINHAITQSPDKWNEEMTETINRVFEKHDELKKAYQISQDFKNWYDYRNHSKSTIQITKCLYQWYEQARQLKVFESVIKMIRKHEDEIINFFQHGMTNAKAERLNGKIQRFLSGNYGIKDKDFFLYRTANYFS
ncbi:MAG: transposase [Bacteroidales bacterium]|jgi:transposase|nr:transposase [Bacteroidales bacterium]